MPRLSDLNDVRARLERDRPWSAFALADLEPPYSNYADWFIPTDDPHAIALLYRAFGTPIVLCAGQSNEWPVLLRQMDEALGDAREVHAVIKPEILSTVRSHYHVLEERPMLRMLFDESRFQPVRASAAERLGPSHLEEVRALFGDEPPAFFLPSTLEEGLYYGIREGDRLVTVAGTHVVSRALSVAALGNIYTRPDRRGRGLGTAVTSAVTHELMRTGIATIVLNVLEDNHPAIRVYQRLGFERYCEYYEVPASLRI
jgi:GNAT superfamily N-acetyltransferase